MHEPRLKGKSHDIPKQLVWDAWLKVKENGGAAGADGVTIEQFEENLRDNLFQLWNRMSSGSYFPGPVRAVEIPRAGLSSRDISGPGCRRRETKRKATSLAALSRAVSGPRAVQEPGHVRNLHAREPGDPTIARP